MKRFLTSIWFLALIITLPVILSLPSVFNKYRLELDGIQRKAGSDGFSCFEDMQGDGVSERIESFRALPNILSFQIFEKGNKLFDQFNFPFQFNPRLAKIFCTDYDRDGLKEVYGFTVKSDSIFLSFVEPYEPVHPFTSFFITTINTEQRPELDASVSQLEFVDINGDGKNEIIFSIGVGYNWFPRRLYMFEPETGKVTSSNDFGVHFYTLKPIDFNADSVKEILCVSSSAFNIPKDMEVDFRDDRPRFFLFDNNLNMVLPPAEFPAGIGASLKYFVLDEKTADIIALYNSYSAKNSMTFLKKCRLGNTSTADSLFLGNDMGKTVGFYRVNEDRFIVLSDLGKVLWVDKNLEIIHRKDLEFKVHNWIIGGFDILGDGQFEYFTQGVRNNIHIYLNNFQDHIKFTPDILPEDKVLILNTPERNQLMVEARDTLHYYSLSFNPFYYLRIPVYFLIYAFILCLIWIWHRARMKQLKEKFELKNQVRELRLKTFRNQLNPHFIFNTFNGVASVIKKGDTQKAYEVFMQFSKLTRNMLDNFDETIITLGQEMELVTNFLELQKFRFKNLFEYEIEHYNRSLNEIKVPRMIVQIHVENAIRHGILPKKKKGLLDIQIKKAETLLQIIITDNGVGRDKTQSNHSGTGGVGLITIQRIIDEINDNSKHKIIQKIYDLQNEDGTPAGTRIELNIPNCLT